MCCRFLGVSLSSISLAAATKISNSQGTKISKISNEAEHCRCCLLSFAGFLALSFASQGMEEEPTPTPPEPDTPPHAVAATRPSLHLSQNHQYGAPSQKKPVCGGGGGRKGSKASGRGGVVTLGGGVVRGVLCGGAIVAVGLAADVAVVSALRWVSAMHLITTGTYY